MATFLFDNSVFGPVHSRRLGLSLGINLLPVNMKVCNFDCVYCECGITACQSLADPTNFPSVASIVTRLTEVLSTYAQNNKVIDSITFAGNGEPTLHPDFPKIVDEVIDIRNKYMPDCVISVLSNAGFADQSEIIKALLQVDNRILKLDAGTEETFCSISRPSPKRRLDDIVATLRAFNGNLTVQSLFVKYQTQERTIDNTLPSEIDAWLKILSVIRPRLVMIYSTERDTAERSVERIPLSQLEHIAKQVEAMNIKTQVFGKD